MNLYNAYPDKRLTRELWNTSENKLIKIKIKMGLIEIPVHKKFHISPDYFEKIFPETNKRSAYSHFIRLSETPPRELLPDELITKNIFKSKYKNFITNRK